MLRPYTSVIIHYFRDSDKREGVEERDSRSAGLRSPLTSDLGPWLPCQGPTYSGDGS
jgi:hypothetical protein